MKIQKFFSSFDYIIFISAILLTIIGILFIYSANLSRSDLNREFIKQIIFASIGLIILITLLFIPTKSMSDFSLTFYIICIFGLIITLFFPYIKGQRRLNIFGVSFQFSEFMKIATIFLLSLYYSKKNKEEIRSILTYIIGLLIVLIPVGLILLQPDLGTMLVFIPIVLVISFMAGIKKRYIIYTLLFIFSITIIPVATSINHLFFNDENELIYLLLNPKYIIIVFSTLIATLIIALLAYFNVIKGINDKFRLFFYWYIFFMSIFIIGGALSYPVDRYILKGYQKDRLLIFFNPEFDPKDKGFHIIQSKNTIGNGGLLGKGWTKGELTQNYFLPEQATDFIYPVIAEEKGYLGSLIILILYGLIFFRGFHIVLNAKDNWSAYVIIGLMSMLLFHIFENMGMCLGIMPITGIPLPFLSYGGSFLMSCFTTIGIILNIGINKYQYN